MVGLLIQAPQPAIAFEWPGRLERLLSLLPALPPEGQDALLFKLRDFPAAELAPHAPMLFATVHPDALPSLIGLCTDLRVPVALQLEELLRHADSGVRASATRALGLVGGCASASRVVRRLDDAEAVVRQAAAEALGHMGSDGEVAGPLIRALEDRHRSVALAALRSIVRRSLRSSAPALVDRALDGRSPVRVEAYRALGALRADAATEVLVAGLRDTSAAVRLAAAEALGQLRSREAVVALTASLRDSPAIAWAAARALGGIGGDRAIPDLAGMLRRGPARPAAARALATLHATAALEAIAATGPPEAVAAARQALRGPLARLPGEVRSPPVLPDDLLPALRHSDPAVRAVAASILAVRVPSTAAALLTDSWDALPVGVRPVVLRALAVSGAPAAERLIAERLESGSSDERRAILVGLAGATRAPPTHALGHARALTDHPEIGPAAQALLSRSEAPEGPGWIEIRTVGPLGRPAPRVPIDITLSDGRRIPARTDGEGIYRVSDAPPGAVTVEVRPLSR